MRLGELLKKLLENFDSLDDEIEVVLGRVEGERVLFVKAIEIAAVCSKGLVVDQEETR